MMNTRKKGFTLIEVTIVLGIIAILVALAIPSFQDTLRKSRRADAVDSILSIMQAQEMWRANHTSYGTLAQLVYPNKSKDGHYDLVIPTNSNTATGYTIVATPVALGDQAKDYCGSFTLTNAAGVITKTNTATNADLCWRK